MQSTQAPLKKRLSMIPMRNKLAQQVANSEKDSGRATEIQPIGNPFTSSTIATPKFKSDSGPHSSMASFVTSTIEMEAHTLTNKQKTTKYKKKCEKRIDELKEAAE